jgi:hypothetical protein
MARLTRVRGDECQDGRTCPAVDASDRGTVVVTGTLVTDSQILAQLAIGPGEAAVEIPAGLLPEVQAP